MEWDFTKLPQHEHEPVLAAWQEQDFRTLLDIHNRYRLNGEVICCNPKPQLQTWFGYAIEKGIIKPMNIESTRK